MGWKKAVLLSSYNYEWAYYRPALEKIFQSEDPHSFLDRMMREDPGAQGENVKGFLVAFRAALRSQYPEWTEEFFNKCFALITKDLIYYENVKRVLTENLTTYLKVNQVAGSLFTFCSATQFLLNLMLKRSDVPTASYQHGSYYLEDHMLKYCESLPASKSFVFGERDAEFFQRVDENAKPKLYGSPSYFDGRAFQNPKGKKVVYFVSPLLGNHWQNTTDFSRPGPDGIELWHRHREIITFFSKMKGWQLVIKIHPGIKVMMGEPIAEYIQDHYWDNVTIDIYSESNTTYSAKTEKR